MRPPICACAPKIYSIRERVLDFSLLATFLPLNEPMIAHTSLVNLTGNLSFPVLGFLFAGSVGTNHMDEALLAFSIRFVIKRIFDDLAVMHASFTHHISRMNLSTPSALIWFL